MKRTTEKGSDRKHKRASPKNSVARFSLVWRSTKLHTPGWCLMPIETAQMNSEYVMHAKLRDHRPERTVGVACQNVERFSLRFGALCIDVARSRRVRSSVKRISMILRFFFTIILPVKGACYGGNAEMWPAAGTENRRNSGFPRHRGVEGHERGSLVSPSRI